MKKIFNKIIELTDEINFDYLFYYFRGDSKRIRLFKYLMNVFEKITSDERKLDEAKKCPESIKSNLNRQ